MRILFLLEHSVLKIVGGSEIQASYIIQELKKRTNHDIHYVFNSNIEYKSNDKRVSYHFLHDHGSASWINFSCLTIFASLISSGEDSAGSFAFFAWIRPHLILRNAITFVHLFLAVFVCLI